MDVCLTAGHFTYQCRNFQRVNPSQEIVLDVSSTSSESSDDSNEEVVKRLAQSKPSNQSQDSNSDKNLDEKRIKKY